MPSMAKTEPPSYLDAGKGIFLNYCPIERGLKTSGKNCSTPLRIEGC